MFFFYILTNHYHNVVDVTNNKRNCFRIHKDSLRTIVKLLQRAHHYKRTRKAPIIITERFVTNRKKQQRFNYSGF